MSELDAQQAAPQAPARSWKLTVAVIALAILPLVLIFPFYSLEQLWIGPIDNEAWLRCGSFDCPPATYLERWASLLILGPSILVALASILLGVIGYARARRHLISPKNADLFELSIILGVVWAGLLGCMLWFAIAVLAGTTL